MQEQIAEPTTDKMQGNFSPEIQNGLITHELLNGQQATFSVESTVAPNEAQETGSGHNGRLIAAIDLPGTGEEPAKQLALLDFGDFDPDNAPSFLYYDGKPVKLFGRVKSRYGIAANNYTPDNHMLAYSPLEKGVPTDVGRQTDVAYELGLGSDERGNEAISRNHFTVTVSEQGEVTIVDHSKNHTRVTYEESPVTSETLTS